MAPTPSSDPPALPPPREYRIEELATLTSTTVRTLQSYRNRGLLPPPRRQGRIAWYSDEHVERLRLIADLIARGYSLAAIAELFDGLGRGEHIHDLLGVEAVAGPAAEPEVVTPREVAAVIGEGPDALTAAVEVGVFAPLGDPDDDANPADRPHAVLLPETLRAGAALIGAGIPAEDVIAEGGRLRADAEAIAERFVALAVEYTFERRGDEDATDATSLTELATRLVPYAGTVISEMVQTALRERLHAEVERQLGRLIAERERRTADG